MILSNFVQISFI